MLKHNSPKVMVSDSGALGRWFAHKAGVLQVGLVSLPLPLEDNKKIYEPKGKPPQILNLPAFWSQIYSIQNCES